MSGAMRTTILLALTLALLLASERAGAEPRQPRRPEARQLLREANRHYKVREFERAIELYKRGAMAEAAPAFWYNLGQAFRQLGQYKDAIWYYRRYLAEDRP